ncbi:WD40/YVTN/BNR-like repeat-containing protein [Kribbella sp. NPDC048928]|uniref:WD40/YVTN/BNR-like repeat-containing protein n=1 Tax=Kribbella sp. NPDC048928 TaxID=3364111 RepID=UPI0037173E3E
MEPRLRESSERFYRRLVELLERCGLPRSMPPFLVLGVLAALTSVVIAVVHLSAPVAPVDKPIAIAPAAAGNPGTSVVNSQRAQVLSITMVTRNRWAAGWSDCTSGPTCKYAAVVDRDGARSVAPEWPVPYATLRAGSEAIAIAPPREGTLTGGATMMYRLTYDGALLTRLRYRLPTTTFQKGEILTDQIVPGRIAVVNTEESSVRILQSRGTRSPSCDGSGRCWMLTGIGRTDLIWTDDGGKSWGAKSLDPHNQLGRLAVSPDGRTLLTTAVTVNATGGQVVAKMQISTDRGANWRTVKSPPPSLNTPPLAFDDGTALMLGGRAGDRPRLYRVRDGAAKLDGGYPGDLADLDGDEHLMYGFEIPRRRTTEVVLSTDEGKTWSKFAPR